MTHEPRFGLSTEVESPVVERMGIVMKNGILLLDNANTLRSRGLSVREAVLEAHMDWGVRPVGYGAVANRSV